MKAFAIIADAITTNEYFANWISCCSYFEYSILSYELY